MNESYVVLTGSMNNAGDFLIRHRVDKLLSWLRPDRELIHADRWKAIDNELLKRINQSKCLILAGGPALRKKMYPEIYPLRDNLDDIEVPIIAMGIGWKSKRGDWSDSRHYPLSAQTTALLERMKDSGVFSSVRDYHSLNVLARHGFKNFVMSGCPASFHQDSIGQPYPASIALENISFSPGVTYLKSADMEKQMREIVLALSHYFPASKLTAVFHHAIHSGLNISETAAARNARFANWLKSQGIDYIDISGSTELMLEHYAKCDLHVGYRVHAHILMCSINRPSILISEDGRGKALEKVLGASVVSAFENTMPRGMIGQLISKGTHLVSDDPVKEVIEMIEYEITNGFPRLSQSRLLIDRHFSVMQQFVRQLP